MTISAIGSTTSSSASNGADALKEILLAAGVDPKLLEALDLENLTPDQAMKVIEETEQLERWNNLTAYQQLKVYQLKFNLLRQLPPKPGDTNDKTKRYAERLDECLNYFKNNNPTLYENKYSSLHKQVELALKALNASAGEEIPGYSGVPETLRNAAAQIYATKMLTEGFKNTDGTSFAEINNFDRIAHDCDFMLQGLCIDGKIPKPQPQSSSPPTVEDFKRDQELADKMARLLSSVKPETPESKAATSYWESRSQLNGRMINSTEGPTVLSAEYSAYKSELAFIAMGGDSLLKTNAEDYISKPNTSDEDKEKYTRVAKDAQAQLELNQKYYESFYESSKSIIEAQRKLWESIRI